MNTNTIGPDDEVILPDYLCHTVIDVVMAFTDKIIFYNITQNLSFSEDEVLILITQRTRVVLIVDFFGVEASISTSLEAVLKQNNILIIKDAAHSFLTLVNNGFSRPYEYDYLISSVYKNIPLQIGAIAIGNFAGCKDFLSFSELFYRFAVLSAKNILCLLGCRNHINRGVQSLSCSDGYKPHLDSGVNAASLYKYIVDNLNISDIISIRLELAELYYDLIETLDVVGNILSKDILSKNILQAYPIFVNDSDYRDKLIIQLKQGCVDAYTWPVFHSINCSDKLWGKILLIPLDKKAYKIMKRIFGVSVRQK